VLVSRAPLPKLEAYKAEKGWSLPWFSSFGSDFNHDFHVTNDEKIAPIEYNYRNKIGVIVPTSRFLESPCSVTAREQD
jgi:predicted dithiol-disulfide oxidoreductase (DUF899 family)